MNLLNFSVEIQLLFFKTEFQLFVTDNIVPLLFIEFYDKIFLFLSLNCFSFFCFLAEPLSLILRDQQLACLRSDASTSDFKVFFGKTSFSFCLLF